MRKLIVIISLFFSLFGRGQVTLQLNLPPSGLSVKNQLWSLVTTNSSAAGMQVHIELRLTDVVSNIQVMNARTNSWLLMPGTQLLQANILAPIEYNINDPAFQSFASTDFLPVGNFVACYSIWRQEGDRVDKIAEECQVVEVEPVSPPQLVLPFNNDTIDNLQPIFNWLPPSPAQLFTGMQFTLELVEVNGNQSSAEAIQQNIPIFIQAGLTATSHPYPAGAPALEPGKKYAWRILVKNNQSTVSGTETWDFIIKSSVGKGVKTSAQSYVKLKKGAGLNYAIAQNELKLEYLNETADTIWKVRMLDLSQARNVVSEFSLDSIPLHYGQNMVRLNSDQLAYLEDRHLYLLQVENSRREVYTLKFEYRRKEK